MSDDFFTLEDGSGGFTPTSVLIKDDKIVIRNQVDLDDTIDAIAELRGEYTDKHLANKLQDAGRLVARIPMPVYDYLMREGIAQDKERLAKWLLENPIFNVGKR